jgi:hypothetical protein
MTDDTYPRQDLDMSSRRRLWDDSQSHRTTVRRTLPKGAGGAVDLLLLGSVALATNLISAHPIGMAINVAGSVAIYSALLYLFAKGAPPCGITRHGSAIHDI